MKKQTIHFCAILLLSCTSSLFSQRTAIHAGHLIDPKTGSIADDQIILIENEKIVDVGANLDVSGQDQIIDLSKSWVMPGLMDAHVHMTLNSPPNVPPGIPMLASSYLREGSGLRALLGMHNAQLALRAGFTTLKDIGNDANYAAVDIRRAIEKGWFKGPTFLNSGKIIGPFGGQSKDIPPEAGLVWQFEYIDADSPAEVRKAVRQNIFYGANTIKLVADNSAFIYSEEEIRAAVDEAHRAGITATVHAYGGQAATNAILAGADAIEHGFELTDDQLELMKEKGTFLVGTDFPYEHLTAFWPEERARKVATNIIDRLARAHKLGVKMAFGTDVVADLPGKTRADMAWDYLDIWLQCGIPPAKILKCMTSNAAELMKIQDQRGAISAGLFADIIATPESPLADIHALQKVHFVMKEGDVIVNAGASPAMTQRP